MTGGNLATLDLLCQIACECLGNGNQNCVASTLNQAPRTPTDGLYPEITFSPAVVPYRNPDGLPQTRMGVAGSRLDVTKFQAGRPTEFYEMKFPRDTAHSAAVLGSPAMGSGLMKTTETVGMGMTAADAILTHSGGKNVLAPDARIMLTCGEYDLMLSQNANSAVDATLFKAPKCEKC